MKRWLFLTFFLFIWGVPNVVADYEASEEEIEYANQRHQQNLERKKNPIEIELDKEYTGIIKDSWDEYFYKLTIKQPTTIVPTLTNKEGVKRWIEICLEGDFCPYFTAEGDMDWLKKRNQPIFKETQYAYQVTPGSYLIMINGSGENDEYSFKISSQKFSDVDIMFWAYNEIDYIYSKGIIQGYNGTFNPQDTITKAQAAVMFARALSLDTNASNLSFKDVPANHWAYKEIVAATKAGLFPQDSNFKPNDPLTRAEMARVLVKGYNLTGTYNGIIKDVSDSDTLNYVKILSANGITNISADNTFKPKNSVTRAEFAAFFARILNDKYKNYNRDIGIRPADYHK